MKFDIQDTDNNRVIIEANDESEATKKFFDLYPNSSLGTIGVIVEDEVSDRIIVVTETDIEYFRKKLQQAIETKNSAIIEKARKRLEMMEDSLVIYRLTRTQS